MSASYSMAEVGVPPNDMRFRLRSTVASAERARLPVLRFFGNDNGGTSLPRPRSPSPVLSSVPAMEETTQSAKMWLVTAVAVLVGSTYGVVVAARHASAAS